MFALDRIDSQMLVNIFLLSSSNLAVFEDDLIINSEIEIILSGIFVENIDFFKKKTLKMLWNSPPNLPLITNT